MVEPKLRENSRDYAYRLIREMIVNMNLEPGSKVSETELAELLGVSRTPVREALIDLARNGAVTIQPQKGTFISLIDPLLVEEARFLRLTIEKEIVSLLCEDEYQTKIHLLEDSISLQEFYLNQGNYEKFLELDDELHQKFFQLTNKTRIYSLMKGLNIHFDRARINLFKKKPSIETLEEHKLIISAIRAQNKELAQQYIEQHLAKYELDKANFEKEYGHYFNQNK